jgi:hypothetical protein
MVGTAHDRAFVADKHCLRLCPPYKSGNSFLRRVAFCFVTEQLGLDEGVPNAIDLGA